MPEPQHINFSDLTGFHAKQVEATKAIDKYKYLLYGGAKSGGKSYWLRWALVRQLCKYAAQGHLGVRGALFCEDYPTLKDRQVNKIELEFPPWLGSLQTSNIDGLSFKARGKFGGWTIILRNLDDPSKYMSSEFAICAVDELTRNRKETFDQLRSIIRWPKIADTKFIAASNPGSVGHCVPFGDVLTKNGWKSISDVKVGESVASVDDKDRMVYLPVEQVHKYTHKGRMAYYRGNTTTIVATEEHKICVRTETKNKSGRVFHDITQRKISDVAEVTRYVRTAESWNGERIKQFSPPTVKTRRLKQEQPTVVSGDDYCEFMGWFLSEGFTLDRDKMFGICQNKIQNRQKIKELLDRMGFYYHVSPTQFTVYSPVWWEYLRKFGKCRNKHIPYEIKNTTTDQMKMFWSAAMLGDGHHKTYYTISNRLANDMQEIGMKLGYCPRLSQRQRKNRDGLSYEINFRDDRLGWLEKKDIKWKEYDGEVYCLGIKQYHRFFLRQNGTVWLSGNSWVKKLWIDKDAEDEPEIDKFFYIPATVYDNPHIEGSYIQQLEALPEEKRKAYLYGSWDVFDGQFFSEWRESIHSVKHYEPPTAWPKYLSIDYGRTKMFSAHWYARKPNGHIYCYREYCKENTDADVNFSEVKKLCREPLEWSVLDAACFATVRNAAFNKGIGDTIADIAWRNGICASPSAKNRKAGWNLVHQYLRWQTRDTTGKMISHDPLLTFSTQCEYAITSLPSLAYNKFDLEDLDTKGDDHAADDLSYFLQAIDKPLAEEKKIEQVQSVQQGNMASLIRKAMEQNSVYNNPYHEAFL